MWTSLNVVEIRSLISVFVVCTLLDAAPLPRETWYASSGLGRSDLDRTLPGR
jgi:hypothetical protein